MAAVRQQPERPQPRTFALEEAVITMQSDEAAPGDSVARLCAHVRGTVQGVGFRWWVRARALELGLVGYARNLADGRVEVQAQGDPAACWRLLELLEPETAPTQTAAHPHPGPPRPGQVTGLAAQWLTPRTDMMGFRER